MFQACEFNYECVCLRMREISSACLRMRVISTACVRMRDCEMIPFSFICFTMYFSACSEITFFLLQ